MYPSRRPSAVLMVAAIVMAGIVLGKSRQVDQVELLRYRRAENSACSSGSEENETQEFAHDFDHRETAQGSHRR
jgi:hypothetical protein